jgi:hypothetical protein
VKCEKCGKEIPPHEEKMVEINGSTHFKYPYCADCAGKIREQMDRYPRFNEKKEK